MSSVKKHRLGNTFFRYFALCLGIVLFLSQSLFSAKVEPVHYINSISTYWELGGGIFPTGTSFEFRFPYKGDDTELNMRIVPSFGLSDAGYGGFNFYTGAPWWNNDGSPGFFDGSYTFVWSDIQLQIEGYYLRNPFGERLFYSWAGLDIRYEYAMEYYPFQRTSTGSSFVNPDGSYKEPFGPGSVFPGWPWLQDDRQVLSNYLYAGTAVYLRKTTGFEIYDGLEFSVSGKYGPGFLANTIVPAVGTTDFWSVDVSATGYMTLFSKKQENDMNWINLMLKDTVSYNHTGGNKVPRHVLPENRFSNRLSNSLTLIMYGPQFITGDCYPYISFSINNGYRFGPVVNSILDTSYSEFTGSLNWTFHLRLFGFVHFDYGMWYNFMHGIGDGDPVWGNSGSIGFYFSV